MKDEALKLAEIAESLAIELPADWSSGEPKNVMTDISAMIRRLVEELDKKGELVAWMNPTGLEYKQRASDFMYNDALYDKKLDWIPLYTTPQTKPLSDEEILKFIHEKFLKFRFEADYIVEDNELIDFARAIEERIKNGK